MRKLDFIIFGAQKSASTFLQDCIASSPDIYMPPSETVIFESPDWEAGGVEAFFNEVETKTDARLVGIRRPNSLGIPEVPGRIAETVPSVKLIAVLRHPLDRFRSAYHHNIAYGFFPAIPLNRGVRLLLDRKMEKRWKRSHEILDFSLYANGIRRYVDLFKRDQFLFLTHDEVVKDSRGTIERVLGFLGASAEFDRELLRTHPQRVEYGIVRLRWQALRNRFQYDYNSNRTRLTPKEKPGSFCRLGLKAWDTSDRFVSKVLRPYSAPKPDFDAATLQRLVPLFSQDIEETERLTGLDLQAWKDDPRMRGGE